MSYYSAGKSKNRDYGRDRVNLRPLDDGLSLTGFEELVRQLNSDIRALAHRYNPEYSFVDSDDLAQEAITCLWLKWKEGKLKDKNRSYILRGCYFDMKNFIRKSREVKAPLSLDMPIDQTGISLKEVIIDSTTLTKEDTEANFFIESIRNNGLTSREKQVFEYFLEGFNTRQIGKKLGISHVRVVQLEHNIWGKARSKLKEHDK